MRPEGEEGRFSLRRFFSKLRRVAGRFRSSGVRLYRILRFGEDLKFASFEANTSERVRYPRPRRSWAVFISRWLAEVLQATRHSYETFIKENRVLLPDPVEGLGGVNYAKVFVRDAYKNCFILSRGANQEVPVKISGDEVGFYFFVGRHPSWNDTGFLEVALTGRSIERIVLNKSISALAHSWCGFYCSLEPHEVESALSGNLRMRFSLIRANTSRVFPTVPIFKSKRASRTVVVFVCDALRPGDLGIYAGTPHSPSIDHMFQDGHRFDRSFSQSNWTLPTFASMALSEYASCHNIVDPDQFLKPLSREKKTLAELFRANGFFTYGSMSHQRSNHSMGHHRGYEHFYYVPTILSREGTTGARGHSDMRIQLREFCDYLRNLNGTDFFGFVHLFDTHFPYFQTPHSFQKKNLLFPNGIEYYLSKSFRCRIDEHEKQFIMNQYFHKLSELDYHLGEAFTLLRNRENTTVILTSDHGYTFDHHLSNLLTDEEIRTPFLFYSNEFSCAPPSLRRVVESSIDLLPTLASLYELNDPAERQGCPLWNKDWQIIPKDYAISELVYLKNFRIKIVDKHGGFIVFSSSRTRSTFEIDLVKMKIVEEHTLGIPLADFRYQMRGYLEQAELMAPLKKRLIGLLAH